jgi:hypothetical protein
LQIAQSQRGRLPRPPPSRARRDARLLARAPMPMVRARARSCGRLTRTAESPLGGRGLRSGGELCFRVPPAAVAAARHPERRLGRRRCGALAVGGGAVCGGGRRSKAKAAAPSAGRAASTSPATPTLPPPAEGGDAADKREAGREGMSG